jgi:hypothetical protein
MQARPKEVCEVRIMERVQYDNKREWSSEERHVVL